MLINLKVNANGPAALTTCYNYIRYGKIVSIIEWTAAGGAQGRFPYLRYRMMHAIYYTA